MKSIYLYPLLVSQTYWPAENECTSSARGGVSATAIVSVSDMQVRIGWCTCQVSRVSCNVLQGSFFTLLLGIVVSFLVLALELCCAKGKGKEFGDTPVKTFTP